MELYVGLFITAVLVFICLLSSKISSHLNMPSLLVFLAVGMIAGSEGIGGLSFDNAKAANYIGSTAMAFILFSGAFDTDWKSVRRVFVTGGILSSLGVLLTALIVGIFAWGLFAYLIPEKDISLSWCLLLGSVISSTDAAAVFSILRSRNVSLRGKLQPLLELESGSNDPMAAFLTLFMVGVVLAEDSSGTPMPLAEYWTIFPTFAVKMSVGLVVGLCTGWIAARLYNKIDFDYNGLYYVLGLVVVLISYSLPELIEGNGFMGVYAAGMVMGNSRFVFHNGVGKFYDGIAWMMQVALFSMLGLLAFPSQIWEAKWIGISVAAFLMLFARPLAVFICMAKSSFSMRERALVSWVGLRGGAPIMLATFPLMAELENSSLMFNVVFFIVLSSVLIQGMTIMPFARLLGLDAPLHKAPRMPLSIEETGNADTDSLEVTLPDSMTGRNLVSLELPEGTLILLIQRGEKFIVPRGETKLMGGDVLTLMGGKTALKSALKTLTDDATQESPQ